MVRIILNGCLGKMGRMITSTAKNFNNVSIVAGIDKFSDPAVKDYPIYDDMKKCDVSADVVLDFSRPDSLEGISAYCKDKKLSVVFCTTGYSSEQLGFIDELSRVIPVFRSANMSIGVNVINNVLKQISSFLYENYDIEIIEKHHNQKVDSPSGTALLLANTIKDSISESTKYVYGREGISKRESNEIGIHAIRGGSIVGEHEVLFAGTGEIISIGHTALSREVFAVGALKACEFMYNKAPKLYNMDDVLNIK
jgi:4-hydroxy-tetrahydrodipicolinate reductase